MESLLTAFWEEILAQAKGFKCRHATVSAELSLNSEAPRVHLHAYLHTPRQDHTKRATRGSTWLEARLRFRGQLASHHQYAIGTGRNRNDAALKQGHFYLQAKKLGHVGCRTDYRKWYDFTVSSKWVWDLYKQRKISIEQAILEFVNGRDRAAHNVAEILKGDTIAHKVATEAAWRRAQQTQPLRPFKPPAPEELEFLGQFAFNLARLPGWRDSPAARAVAQGALEAEALPRRCKFLVYNGPTRLGKTERAAHWFGSTETLVLNCQGVTTPCLREMHTGAWRAVVYDESDWRLPASQRALLQSAPRPITLGQSNCNEAVYNVVMHGVPQIICSNEFWKGCGAEDMEARLWIQGNAWILNIDQKTWVE